MNSGTGNATSSSIERSREESEEEDEGDDDGETTALLVHQQLPPLAKVVNGGIARGRQKSSSRGRRRVQWNDRNGNKLVQILEFYPSDSSDSEAEYAADSCICTIM